MTFKKVTQLELEEFSRGNEMNKEPESGEGFKALTAQEVRERSVAARQALGEHLERGEPVDWAETYHRLINAGWPWRMAAWVAWCTIPKAKRWPRTQDELAVDVLGLTSDRTIANWRKKFPAIEQLIADLQADEMLDSRGDVFHALKLSASTPDYKHSPDRRIFLTMTGDYAETSKLTLNKKPGMNLKELSDSELAALAGDPEKIRALLNQLSEDEDASLDE